MHAGLSAAAPPIAQQGTKMFSVTRALCLGSCTCGPTADTDATPVSSGDRSMDATGVAGCLTQGRCVTRATALGKFMRAVTTARWAMSQVCSLCA